MKPWSAVRASLNIYPRELIAEAMTAHLEASIPDTPRNLGADWKQPVVKALEAVIAAHTGLWYQPFSLGTEELTHWCICHSFFGYHNDTPTKAQIPENVQAMMLILDGIHDFVCAVGSEIERVHVPPDPVTGALVIRERLMALIELVIARTELHEAWYRQVTLSGQWLLSACGLTEEASFEALRAALNAHFRSWSCSEENKVATADEAALVSVRALFEERYG